MRRIIAVLATALILTGTGTNSIRADTSRFDLSVPLQEVSRQVPDPTIDVDIVIRCAGLYSSIFFQLEPEGLDRNRYAPYQRSTIILKHLVVHIIENYLLGAQQLNAPFTDQQTKHLISEIEYDIYSVAELYLERMESASARGLAVLDMSLVKDDMATCKEIHQVLAPDSNRGTPGKLPRESQ